LSIVKTSKEIAFLKKAARVSDSCIPIIKTALKEGVTEKELQKRVEQHIKRRGCGISFATLVSCGERSAMVHAKPHVTDKKIAGIGHIDFGASYKNYKSDVTIPFVVGKIGKKERKIVAATEDAYKLAIKSIKIGMSCWRLHEKVNTFLKKRGFYMIHPMGHGLGKKIHELPYIGKPRKRPKGWKKKRWEKLKKIVFQEGMVFTIEPAVYVEGVGGCRLENDVLLTRKGPQMLTHARLIKI